MNIYQNGYMKLSYNMHLSLFEHQWTENCEKLKPRNTDNQQVISLLYAITVQMAQKYKPTCVLINSQDLNKPVYETLNSWQFENISQRLSTNGVTKVAIVFSPETQNELARKHSSTKLASDNLLVQYFDDRDKAKSWLLKG